MAIYTGTPALPPLLAGDVPSGAADWAAIAAALHAATDALTSYTPTWQSSGVVPVLGNGSLVGRYRQTGSDVFAQVILTAGSTTTFGTGFFTFALPPGTSNSAATDGIGSARLFDVSAGTQYSASCVVLAGIFYAKLLAGSTGEVSATSPFTFATGDVAALNVRFQA